MIHETTQDFRIRYNLSQSGLNRTRMMDIYIPKVCVFDSYFIALAKIKDAILITDDGRMHFHAKEVGVVSILIREIDLTWIENKLKEDS